MSSHSATFAKTWPFKRSRLLRKGFAWCSGGGCCTAMCTTTGWCIGRPRKRQMAPKSKQSDKTPTATPIWNSCTHVSQGCWTAGCTSIAVMPLNTVLIKASGRKAAAASTSTAFAPGTSPKATVPLITDVLRLTAAVRITRIRLIVAPRITDACASSDGLQLTDALPVAG